MHKSLYADLEKTIERLKKCLKNYICDIQLNQVRLIKVIHILESII